MNTPRSILCCALLLACTASATVLAASVNAKFDGDSISTDLHKAKVEVLAVDGKLRSGRVVWLEPGSHMLTLVSSRPPKTGRRPHQLVAFTAEPCKRYVVSAEHADAHDDEWKLVVERVDPLAGCDPAAYTPPPPPTPQKYKGYDQELSMLGDRLSVRTIGERCGAIIGDEARGAAAIARWESQNGAAVDAVEDRLKHQTIAMGMIRYETAVKYLQLFEEGIAEHRERVTTAALGEGDLAERCALALADLEKRVAVYERSLAARKAVKSAREYEAKHGQDHTVIDKNWPNLIEDAEVVGGYWRLPAKTE